MKYITLETKSLVDLIGRNEKDKIDWEKIGTNANTINLDDLSFTVIKNDKIIYLIPVLDEKKAKIFLENARQFNVEVKILDKKQAEIEYEKLVLYKKNKEQ